MTPVHKPDNPNLTITALPALILTGNNSAAQQSAVLETQAGPAELAIAADFGDPLGIGSSWNTSEFNVLGLSDSQAVFNVGAAIVVQLDATVDNGAAALPQCVPGKFSGETNNLTVIGCCPVQFGPNGPGTEAVNRVLITESNALIPPISMCSCPAGSSWDPSNEACTMPVSNNPRCFSGLGGDEIFCPRLDRCVTKAEYKAECLFHKPTPP
jgi:hypothetical protein